MAEGGEPEEPIPLHELFRLRRKDWGARRDDGLITISDDSDEELPFIPNTPVQKNEEDEEEDDVVILEERRHLKLSRPDIIRPAASWHGTDRLQQGRDLAANDHHLPGCRRSLRSQLTKSRAEPGHAGDADFLLAGPSDIHKNPEREDTRPKAGPSGPHFVNVERTVVVKREPIATRAGGSQPEREPDVALLPNKDPRQEGAPSIQRNSQLDHPYYQADDAALEFVAHGHVLRQRHPAAIQTQAQDERPGPAFPSAEPLEDGVCGLASPPLNQPPEALGAGLEELMDHDPPGAEQGTAEPDFGDLHDHGAVGLDKELIALLIRETEARFPDVKDGYIEELILSKQYLDLNVICNVLLENPDYPKKEGGIVLNKNSSLLASSEETKQKVDLFDFAHLLPLDQRCFIQASDLLMADFKMLSSQDIKWALHELKGHYAITRKTFSDAIKKWQELSPEASGKRRRRKEMNQFSYIDFKFEQGMKSSFGGC
ncbi:hypothetical protein FKM82_002850 [Ascaphus truei]